MSQDQEKQKYLTTWSHKKMAEALPETQRKASIDLHEFARNQEAYRNRPLWQKILGIYQAEN